MAPRSILKARLSPPPPPSVFISQSTPSYTPSLLPFPFSPHVHFPPTPALVSGTGNAHSSSAYDRAPITVSPNACALPPRGSCTVIGSYFHPRAKEVCQLEKDTPQSCSSSRRDSDGLPDLIPDVSSPSSSSDDCMSPPSSSPPDNSPLFERGKGALSFLPHPHQHTNSSSSLQKKKKRPSFRRRATGTSGELLGSSEGCLGGF